MTASTRPASPVIDQQHALHLLDVEEQALRRVLRELRDAERDERSASGPAIGLHLADVASDMFEREADLGLIDEFAAGLDDVAAARRRVADGSYGRCERCHQSIGMARLNAVPTARNCRRCAGELEHVGGGVSWARGGRHGMIPGEFLPLENESGPDNAEDAAVTVQAV